MSTSSITLKTKDKKRKKISYPVKIKTKGLTEEQLEKIEKLKKQYAEKRIAIERDTSLEDELYREAWSPAQYEYDKNVELQEIKRKRQTGLVYQSEEEYEKAVASVEKRYQQRLSDFGDISKREASIKKKYSNADALLTASEHISIYKYEGNNNTLIFGGSGCGKTRSFVMPNVLQAHSSFVITDPKGEILEKAGYFLTKVKGYKVRVLNLDAPPLSDCYNPFHYIHPEREGFEERVLTLIKTIIMNTNGGEDKGSSDPFWQQAEECFLQALFFFTVCYFKEEERTINTFLKLMSMLKLEEDKDDQNSALDLFVKEEFAKQCGKDHIGIQMYNEFRDKASGKTAKSIVMSAVARFAPFRTKEISRILSADSMKLELLGEEKTAIFVVVPPTDTTFNFMAGMLFTQMFQELQYCATQVHKAEGQRLPVPVRFLLDEFANTCKIPQFEKILAYARSFGIGICPILQSLEQLKKMFDKEWGTIIDNCFTMLYLGGVTHPETLEYLVKLVGKGTFDKKTTSQTKGRNGSNSTSYDKIGRELLDMSEIRQLPKTDCLLFVGGRPAFWSKKYDYLSHDNYKWTSDSNSRFHFDYTPIVPPVEEERKRRIEEALKEQEKEEQERKRLEADAELKKRAKEQGLIEMAAILENIDREKDYLVMQRPTNAMVGSFVSHAKSKELVLVSRDDLDLGYKEDISAEDDYMQPFFEDSNNEDFVSILSDESGAVKQETAEPLPVQKQEVSHRESVEQEQVVDEPQIKLVTESTVTEFVSAAQCEELVINNEIDNGYKMEIDDLSEFGEDDVGNFSNMDF